MTVPLSPTSLSLPLLHYLLSSLCLFLCWDYAAQLPLDLGLPHVRVRQEVRGLKQKAVGILFPAPSLMQHGSSPGLPFLVACL